MGMRMEMGMGMEMGTRIQRAGGGINERPRCGIRKQLGELDSSR